VFAGDYDVVDAAGSEAAFSSDADGGDCVVSCYFGVLMDSTRGFYG
jgi:hypothetical protein